MALRNVYICTQCAEHTPRWQGKCPNCSAWNALVEDVVDTKQKKMVSTRAAAKSVGIDDIHMSPRFSTGIVEFDRVLGGGIVSDALVLLTGDPGIGKSTLALQVAMKLTDLGKKVLYVSGEESVGQISGRAKRLGKGGDLQILSETNLENALAVVDQVKPDLVVADSVQTLVSSNIDSISGTISQVRTVADRFMEVTKQKGVPTILIGHVTKQGSLAGPKVLEHLVDCVLYLEGDRYHELRILRAQKNRFGSTMEVGVFAMEGDGLREVSNPSEIFLEGRSEGSIGSIITVTMEGARPFLVEIQALTNTTDSNYPRRTSSGLDMNRVQLLTAVLNKHARAGLDQQDVFTNIAGGFKVREPSVDLAICAAILSSRQDISVPPTVAVFGEVGLSGEVRPVTHEERRIAEAKKLGFSEVWGNFRREVPGVTMIRSVLELKKLMSGLGQSRRPGARSEKTKNIIAGA
jgi:DNA repair protein RadA/Sms